MIGSTSEQFRTIADLMDRNGKDWMISLVMFQTWLIVAASDGTWRIFPDGRFEKVKFVDHGFAT